MDKHLKSFWIVTVISWIITGLLGAFYTITDNVFVEILLVFLSFPVTAAAFAKGWHTVMNAFDPEMVDKSEKEKMQKNLKTLLVGGCGCIMTAGTIFGVASLIAHFLGW